MYRNPVVLNIKRAGSGTDRGGRGGFRRPLRNSRRLYLQRNTLRRTSCGRFALEAPATGTTVERSTPMRYVGAASLQGDHTPGSFYWKEFYQDGDPKRSEDCLYLNVWTPAAGKPEAKLPVIFWIHGGAYMGGYGHEIEFGGDAYAKKGVILVTINYRLGMCGFLAHPLLTAENNSKGSGNYGLFDQLTALKWVKRNISAFGGNPDNITVMGQSAGAGSVQALISSPTYQRAYPPSYHTKWRRTGRHHFRQVSERSRKTRLRYVESCWNFHFGRDARLSG